MRCSFGVEPASVTPDTSKLRLLQGVLASSVVILKANVTVNYSTRSAVCVTAGPLLQAKYLRKEEPVQLIKLFIVALQAPFSK